MLRVWGAFLQEHFCCLGVFFCRKVDTYSLINFIGVCPEVCILSARLRGWGTLEAGNTSRRDIVNEKELTPIIHFLLAREPVQGALLLSGNFHVKYFQEQQKKYATAKCVILLIKSDLLSFCFSKRNTNLKFHSSSQKILFF